MAEPQDDPSGRLPDGGVGDQGPELGERPFIPADQEGSEAEAAGTGDGEAEGETEAEEKPKRERRSSLEDLERRLSDKMTQQFQAMQSTLLNKAFARQREADAPAAKPALSAEEQADELTEDIYKRAETIDDPVKRERFIVREMALIPIKIQRDIRMNQDYSTAMESVKAKWPFLSDDEIKGIARKVASRPVYEHPDTAWSEEVERHLAATVERGESYKKVLEDRFKIRRRAAVVQGNSGQPPAKRKPVEVPPMTMVQQRGDINKRKAYRGTG